MQCAAIEVDRLHKSYDGQPVLFGVSFAVGGNGIFGIAGGTATTVAILQGLCSRDGGHVAVLGLDPARARAAASPPGGSAASFGARRSAARRGGPADG